MERDADLEAVYLHADMVNPVGVQRLINALQTYRTLVRQAADYIDKHAETAAGSTSMYELRQCALSMNSRLSELQFTLDLDHIDLSEICNGQQ